MKRPPLCLPLRWLVLLCLLSSMGIVWLDRTANAQAPPLADHFSAEALRPWYDRLGRFDQELPDTERLGIERLIAYEENAAFTYAFGSRSAPQDDSISLRFRRVLLIKPGLLIVDDLWAGPGTPQRIGRIGWTPTPIQVPVEGNKPLPGLDRLQWLDTADRLAPASTEPDAALPSTGAIRTVCLFRTSDAGQLTQPIDFQPLDDRAAWRLTLGVADRCFDIELPRAFLEPGWMAATASEPDQSIPRRPLAAGILPHGPEGVELIERWDRPYRGQQRPGWDTGLVAEDLKRAVREGLIQPGRAVELGCGSGTNAIYLASQGFEVTAIDVAPTSLAIAEAKANEAGVQVRWVLADVLNLPDLGTFDLIFDRGCYHNVRYVDAEGFVRAMCQLTRPGSRALIVSLNRDGPPGIREATMREDFSESFDFVQLQESEIRTGADGGDRRASWFLLLQRK
ncbi:MAG: class I SAM-dependent methyltransferase [Planctomycetaceae bacterium]|nr:MAG: class I SAM-dependent methyltransferase [Planctomycetaceae bacterium]